MLTRFFLGSVVCCFVLYPQVISCATSKKADRTVDLDRAAEPPVRFEETERFEIKYGEDPDRTLGFNPGGNETEKLAPNSFEIRDNGDILVSDPVHRKVFRILRSRGSEPTLQNVGPYSFSSLPGEDRGDLDNGEVELSAAKTGAETADIVFAQGDSKKTIRLKVEGPLASVKALGVTSRGEAAVLVTRFQKLGAMDVSREILLVEKDGAILARLKIDDVPFVPPVSEFQIASDGSLYRMIPGQESVTFVRYEVHR